jgi:hypothetical protein
MRLRLTALATAAALAVVPATSNAASPDQVRDVTGDARGGLASADIVSARWSTAGKGASKALVGTLRLAAPPNMDAPFVYELRSEVVGCGSVNFMYTPGVLVERVGEVVNNPAIADGNNEAGVWLACGGDDGATTSSTLLLDEVTFAVTGNTMTWSVPLSALPSQVRAGSVFYDFEAVSDVGEPVFGISYQAYLGQSLDNAYGDGVWRLK